jgi:alkanesulfonate monooxygenase SsuD/methylene tetrahydromethanopterin reductase-like flavin-dependent oxidoreductase (luciferase family)
MLTIRFLILALGLAASTAGMAQEPIHEETSTPCPHHDGARQRTATSAAELARMERHLNAIDALREEAAIAKTPEEHEAQIAEQMKLVSEGFDMMQALMRTMLERWELRILRRTK